MRGIPGIPPGHDTSSLHPRVNFLRAKSDIVNGSPNNNLDGWYCRRSRWYRWRVKRDAGVCSRHPRGSNSYSRGYSNYWPELYGLQGRSCQALPGTVRQQSVNPTIKRIAYHKRWSD